MQHDLTQMAGDILGHPLFQILRDFDHHGGENSLYDHSVDTAICACRLARAFGLKEERVRAVTRAALLHDFFGYDWRSEEHKKIVRSYRGWDRIAQMHAFSHGRIAAHRASSFFELDARQCAAIASHMFPLAPVPTSSEGWILTLADKVVATCEMSATMLFHMRRWRRRLLPA
jgi:uncharacterized protein